MPMPPHPPHSPRNPSHPDSGIPTSTVSGGSAVWDGTTSTRGDLATDKSPDADDYRRLAVEVIDTQKEVLRSGWTNLTLTGSWTNKVGGSTAAYRTFGKQVKLKGQIAPGTKTDGTTIFTLPTAARPTKATTFLLPPSGADTGDSLGRILIGADGTGKIYGISAATSLDLAGVSFFTDQ